MTAVVPSGPTNGGATWATSGIGRDCVGDGVERRRVRWRSEIDREHQRTVEAGPEALGQQVVATAQRRAGRVLAGVGLTEPHAEQRQRQREDHREAADEVAHRMRSDVVRPLRPAVVVAVVVAGAGLADALHAGNTESIDVVAGEADQRRQQRQRGDHHDDHHDRGTDSHERDERDAGHREPADRDHDGATGDHDRLARRGDRSTGGVFDREPAMQAGAVAGDDEQRVVDAGAEAEHRRQRRHGRRHVDERRDERDGRDSGAEAEDRRRDRKTHGDHGAEREQQDHHRCEQPDPLGTAGRRSLGDLRQLRRRTPLDTPAAAGRGDHVLQLLVDALGQFVRLLVEPNRGERDRSVLGHGHGLGRRTSGR